MFECVLLVCKFCPIIISQVSLKFWNVQNVRICDLFLMLDIFAKKENQPKFSLLMFTPRIGSFVVMRKIVFCISLNGKCMSRKLLWNIIFHQIQWLYSNTAWFLLYYVYLAFPGQIVDVSPPYMEDIYQVMFNCFVQKYKKNSK